MKYAVVILDGASGWPLDELGGLTSLEAAETPNLDFMAARGMVGMAKNVPDGMECSSNVACTSIIGYDPAQYPIGRGAIEGYSAGVVLEPGQVAMRVNLSNVQDGCMFSYSTDNISSEELSPIVDALKAELDDETFTLHKSVGFRAILVVTGHPEIMECSFHAGHNITGEPIADKYPIGPGSDILTSYMKRADAILADLEINREREAAGKLPVNCAWAFWPGMRPDSMEPFSEVYGKSAAMQSGVDLLNGLAALTSMRRCSFPGITDGPDTDYVACGEGALEMLEADDVIFVHIEAPDAEGHDGNAPGKKAAIEAIDREVLGRLLDYAKTHELRIMASPDHPTPVETRKHAHEPVPFVLYGPGIEHNGASRLTEDEARATGLLVSPGHKMMGILLG
ncbi:MAG: 2,3-bisphosphoglycerate-independent phosphoglycerate mutase [bacterium]|nr:2,3-bisphosphoglycerate-independent phosphoglycerate mutase [bacterium]